MVAAGARDAPGDRAVVATPMINPRLPRISPEVSAIEYPVWPAKTPAASVWHRVLGPSSKRAPKAAERCNFNSIPGI